MARGRIEKVEGKRGNYYKIIVEMGKDPVSGERRRKTENIKGKKEAEKRLAELIRAVDTGMLTDPKKMTVAQYLDYWMVTYCKMNLAPSTFSSYSQIVKNHLKPALGRLAIDKLLPTNIQSYYSEALKGGRKGNHGEKGPGLSPTTVLYHHRVLREALQHAVRRQLIARNPADAVMPPKKVRPEMTVFTEDEIAKLLDKLRLTYLYMPTYLAVATGMRAGEILGLSWADVDLPDREEEEGGAITVRRSLNHFKKGQEPVFGEPKTAGSKRRVELFPQAVRELRRYKKEQNEQRLAAGEVWQNYNLVCCYANGAPINPASFARAFRGRTRELNIVGRFHDLRHSHATFLLKHGIHPKVVAERLGHTQIGITMDIYSHVLPSMQKQAAEIIGDHLFESPAPEKPKKKPTGKKSAPNWHQIRD